MRKTRSITVSDSQYAVFNGTEHVVLIFLNEYAVLDRKLNTPYPMKVDRHSTLDHSSSGHSTSGHSLSGHTPPITTITDSSAPSRFVYPPLARTLQYIKACRRWRSAPLSTMYPPMTSELLAGDSSSESSAIPSRKRCRDSISPEDSVKEDIDADVLADIEADASAVVVIADMDVGVGVDAGIGMEVDVGFDAEDEVEGEGEAESSDRATMEVRVEVFDGIDIPDGMLMPDAVERLEQVEEVVQNIYGHVMEIPL
ncbi:hypothetical protein Tco_1547053 [Tanacetum coccineum]